MSFTSTYSTAAIPPAVESVLASRFSPNLRPVEDVIIEEIPTVEEGAVFAELREEVTFELDEVNSHGFSFRYNDVEPFTSSLAGCFGFQHLLYAVNEGANVPPTRSLEFGKKIQSLARAEQRARLENREVVERLSSAVEAKVTAEKERDEARERADMYKEKFRRQKKKKRPGSRVE
ncbi:unnamed protein product [Cochlearia groenlandica]